MTAVGVRQIEISAFPSPIASETERAHFKSPSLVMSVVEAYMVRVPRNARIPTPDKKLSVILSTFPSANLMELFLVPSEYISAKSAGAESL